jgi:hypothetical protein
MIRTMAVLWLLSGCADEPALARQKTKQDLIASMQRDLLVGMEAEKSAVLARTDEESAGFTDAWKRGNAAVETGRSSLRQLVAIDARPTEQAALAKFDESWSRLTAVDAQLLALTEANSNLAANRIAETRGADALDELIDALREAAAKEKDVTHVRTMAEAEVAALRIQILLPAHIDSGDEAEMSTRESRIEALAAVVDAALTSQRAGPAADAWARYRKATGEIIALSRRNTHVKASELSLHEKRAAMLEALNALAALDSAVRDVPRATR